jgi:hypothetical protein
MDQLELWVYNPDLDEGTPLNGWLKLYYRNMTVNKRDTMQDDTTSANYTVTDDAVTLWTSQVKTALGISFAFESVRRADTDLKEMDPGQAYLAILNRKMGHAGKGDFLIIQRDTERALLFKGIVDLTDFGGQLTDVQQFRAELAVSGPVYDLPDADYTGYETWSDVYTDGGTVITGSPAFLPDTFYNSLT